MYHTYVFVCLCNLQTEQVVLMNLVTYACLYKYQYVYTYIFANKNK